MNLFKISKKPNLWRFYLIRTPWFGVKLHWVRKTKDEWHDHPWNGFSLILGYYWEQLADISEVSLSCGQLHLEASTGWRRKWFFNKIGAHKPHRTYGNTLTLFFHGPRVNENWFWGHDVVPWRGPQNDS